MSKVFVYEGEYGSEGVLAHTQRAADVHAVSIILERVKEGSVIDKEERKQLVDMLQEGKYEDAIAFYNEGADQESEFIHMKTISEESIVNEDSLDKAHKDILSELVAATVEMNDDEEDEDLDDEDLDDEDLDDEDDFDDEEDEEDSDLEDSNTESEATV